MDASDLLFRMLSYQAWAHKEILEAMRDLHVEHHAEERKLALRLMNHCLVVNKIFSAHLVGDRHGFISANTSDTPELDELHAETVEVDRWYLRYAEAITSAMLHESVPFEFTDGDKGYMTREEMLTHVVTHGGYHRGEVGRIMIQASARSGREVVLPWDTYAVYLHRSEPARRSQGK
ncbi:damage-inducible protein DinB [Burkholderia sp. Bp9012]|uniref:DinB family protein n=1 Tax=Burkholderia sp. Bp9012 TaxID=2184562 RepID=UPI000F5AFC37|nr:DinB family protein [Burkholderia sp. Bp9012]RQR85260.1 damage-inducible protein DinB [Burkholderia sp. Bp9012]